ncbi:MAG: hypothetical protein HY720_04205 [Planctomycetes bacterium]|nr:hypothetical protein [Planctomycetota bacterium]
MTDHAPSYRSLSGVAWSVEHSGLTLVRDGDGKILHLGYPEAALWDLLCRRRPLEATIRMVAAIARLETQAARKWTFDTIQTWVREGWVVESGGGDG